MASRTSVLTLYRQILRESKSVADYNFREYAARRARLGFEQGRSVTGGEAVSLYEVSDRTGLTRFGVCWVGAGGVVGEWQMGRRADYCVARTHTYTHAKPRARMRTRTSTPPTHTHTRSRRRAIKRWRCCEDKPHCHSGINLRRSQ